MVNTHEDLLLSSDDEYELIDSPLLALNEPSLDDGSDKTEYSTVVDAVAAAAATEDPTFTSVVRSLEELIDSPALAANEPSLAVEGDKTKAATITSTAAAAAATGDPLAAPVAVSPEPADLDCYIALAVSDPFKEEWKAHVDDVAAAVSAAAATEVPPAAPVVAVAESVADGPDAQEDSTVAAKIASQAAMEREEEDEAHMDKDVEMTDLSTSQSQSMLQSNSGVESDDRRIAALLDSYFYDAPQWNQHPTTPSATIDQQTQQMTGVATSLPESKRYLDARVESDDRRIAALLDSYFIDSPPKEWNEQPSPTIEQQAQHMPGVATYQPESMRHSNSGVQSYDRRIAALLDSYFDDITPREWNQYPTTPSATIDQQAQQMTGVATSLPESKRFFLDAGVELDDRSLAARLDSYFVGNYSTKRKQQRKRHQRTQKRSQRKQRRWNKPSVTIGQQSQQEKLAATTHAARTDVAVSTDAIPAAAAKAVDDQLQGRIEALLKEAGLTFAERYVLRGSIGRLVEEEVQKKSEELMQQHAAEKEQLQLSFETKMSEMTAASAAKDEAAIEKERENEKLIANVAEMARELNRLSGEIVADRAREEAEKKEKEEKKLHKMDHIFANQEESMAEVQKWVERGILMKEEQEKMTKKELEQNNWVPQHYIEKAVVLYHFQSRSQNELTLHVDDVVYVTNKRSDGWYEGVCRGVAGLLPGNFVGPI